MESGCEKWLLHLEIRMNVWNVLCVVCYVLCVEVCLSRFRSQMNHVVVRIEWKINPIQRATFHWFNICWKLNCTIFIHSLLVWFSCVAFLFCVNITIHFYRFISVLLFFSLHPGFLHFLIDWSDAQMSSHKIHRCAAQYETALFTISNKLYTVVFCSSSLLLLSEKAI